MTAEQIVENLIDLLRRSAGEQGVSIDEDECLIVADALSELKERAGEALRYEWDLAGEDI
jgi:hypothetical protein